MLCPYTQELFVQSVRRKRLDYVTARPGLDGFQNLVLGALIPFVQPWFEKRGAWRQFSAILGAGLVAASVLAFRPGISFPGAFALLPTLGSVAAPNVAYKSLLDVAQAAYDFERANTAGIHAAYEVALAEKDYPAQVLLHWFINEQVEEEAWADKLLVKTREAGCAGALMNLDRHLEKILAGE